ncbi:unnamed protein product [Rotaria sp. Silwood2]|nr:unnamed protein product [Rotaria sp. Silwood2]
MTHSRHPHRPGNVAAATTTTQNLSSFDDDFVEQLHTSENVTHVPSEETDKNSNENTVTIPVEEDNQNVPFVENERTQLRSNVWNYAKKISKEKSQCNICKKYIKTPGGSTTTLRKHLVTVHNLVHLALEANPRVKIDNSISPEQKLRLDYLANLAIFEDGRTFGDLRKSGISKFLAEAIPDNSYEDDEEDNQDLITDTWSNDIITGDVDNMNIDEVDNEEHIAITKNKLAETIQKGRSLIKVIRRSQILMKFINTEKKMFDVKRRLVVDCITRWNSTYLAFSSLLKHKPVLIYLFENKRKLPLTTKQKEKLGLLELSSDDYTILKNLIDIFEPLYQTTNLLSGYKYPTIGLCLYAIRNLKEYFEKEEENDSNILITLKRFILDALNLYFDEKDEQFSLLMLYGYFDPFGYSVLTRKERLKVERQIKQKSKEQNRFQTPTTTSSALISSNESVYPSIKQNREKLSRLDTFLKSINKYMPTNNVIQKTISEEIFHYGSLVKTDSPMDAVLFWQRYGEQMPILKAMAQKYLSAPGTSVPSESAFSSSAYIGRKERAQLSPENLSYTVFLQDKLRSI